MLGELRIVLGKRLGGRPDSEHWQLLVRIVLVSVALAYLHSPVFSEQVEEAWRVEVARAVGWAAFVIVAGLFAALLAQPGRSMLRRIVGMTNDIFAVSAAIFLGEGAMAGASVVYLWISVGNGFRYGNAYLYGGAVLSLVCFGLVSATSDFWIEQRVLSSNLLILLSVVPPYVGALLKSLHETKKQLEVQARVDTLTGLLNRAETEMTVERMLDRRHDGHWLLFCDLDLFKQVNDNAGHAAGDRLLADVAGIIRGSVRASDVVGRLGGDEFCVLLEHCELDRARQIAEDVRNRVSGYRLRWGDNEYRIGISVGLAPTSAVKDAASLFRLADAACYAAKNAGRNQVHVVDPRLGPQDTGRIRRMYGVPSPAGAAPAR